MHRGSCHCGTVHYEIDGDIRGLVHCHCHTCRKINGTTYGTSAVVARNRFTVTAGEEDLTAYLSSPGKTRNFCRRCGSHVFAIEEALPDGVILRIGTLDGDPGARPEGHIWVSHKAPWYEITDGLPQYAEWRSGSE